MGMMSNSGLDTIFNRSHVITANWWLSDDTPLGFGESNRFKIKYDSGNDWLSFSDPDDNYYWTIENTGGLYSYARHTIYGDVTYNLSHGDYISLVGTQYSGINFKATGTSPNQGFDFIYDSDGIPVIYSQMQWTHTGGDTALLILDVGIGADKQRLTMSEQFDEIALNSGTILINGSMEFSSAIVNFSGVSQFSTGSSLITPTHFHYLSDVTGLIQAQLDSKASGAHTHTEVDITDLDHLTEAEVVDHLEALAVTTPVGGDWVIYSDAGILKRGLINALPVTESQISDLTHYLSSDFNTDFATKTTTNLTEGTNLYYTQARFDSAFTAKSTTNLSEGTNLYYTDARVLSYINTQSVGTHSDVDIITPTARNVLVYGTSWTNRALVEADISDLTHYGSSDFNTDFSGKTTTNLSEGTNLYYTQARFDSAFTAKSTTNLSEGTNLYYTDARVESYGVGRTIAVPVSGDWVIFSDAGVLKRGLFSALDQNILTGMKSYVDGLDHHTKYNSTDNSTDHASISVTAHSDVTSAGSGIIITSAERTKLTGIETGATGDQTGAEIKALYELEANAFTDTLKTKLDGIETGATADQTQADINGLGITVLGTVTSGNIDSIANYSTYGNTNVESYLEGVNFDPSARRFGNGDAVYGLTSAVSTYFGTAGTKAGTIRLESQNNSAQYSLIQHTTTNLHIDNVGGSIYLGYYDATTTYFGTGSQLYITSGGALTTSSTITAGTLTGALNATADVDMNGYDIEVVGTVYKSDASGWFIRLSSTGLDTGTLYNTGLYWDTSLNETFLSGYAGLGLTVNNVSPSQTNSAFWIESTSEMGAHGYSRGYAGHTSYNHFYIEESTFMSELTTGNFYIIQNGYYTSAGWRRTGTDATTLIQMSDQAIYFQDAVSGTAEGTVSYGTRFRIRSTDMTAYVDFDPSSTNVRDMGTTTNYWDELYADNFNNMSDRRLKSNIVHLDTIPGRGLQIINQLKPAMYRREKVIKDKQPGNGRRVARMRQDPYLHELVPTGVLEGETKPRYEVEETPTSELYETKMEWDYGVIADELVGLQGFNTERIVKFDTEGNAVAVDYVRLIPILIQAVKELSAKIDQLEVKS